MIQFRLSSLTATIVFIHLFPTTALCRAHEESSFTACKSIAGSTSLPGETSCPETDLTSISRLQALGFDVSQKFKFESKLAIGVESQLSAVIAKYDRWAKCEGTCAELDQALANLPATQQAMRRELSLMLPDDLASAAIQSSRGWFTIIPKHPFAKSPELKVLSASENAETKTEFFRRLAQYQPEITSRIEAIQSRAEILGRDAQEMSQLQKTILNVRADARQKYLSLIGQNPLLIFLDDHVGSLDRKSLAAAAARLRDETIAEKKRLGGIKNPNEKAEALIEYKSVTENILRQNPRFCVTAEKTLFASDASRKTKAVTLAVGQVAAGFAAAAFCGTIVACGVGAALVASADFGIAAYDAQNAFRSGVASVAMAEAVGDRDVGQAMANADTAAIMQGAVLAMGLPTVMKSGADIVRASASALRAAASKTAPVLAPVLAPVRVKGGLLNETVGAAPASKLNPFLQSFYRDILESHQGREREIIETLIERMQAKGLKPDKISSSIKDRIRQCVR